MFGISAPDRTPTRARAGSTPRRVARFGALLALAAVFTFAGCQDLESDIARQNTARAFRAAQREAERQQLALGDVGYAIGNPDAPVTVVEFSDFGCGFCRAFALESFPTLRKEFIATGKVRWRYVPFVLGIFPNGDRAAGAAICANPQGSDAFWKMHDLLYETQHEWKSAGNRARAHFERLAAGIGLDLGQFLDCYDNDRAVPEVTLNTRLGQQLGVRATPTFFINGVRVEGAIPLDLFKRILEEAGTR